MNKKRIGSQLEGRFLYLQADKTVVARTERTPIDINRIFVFGLPITAIHALGGYPIVGSLAREPVLVVVAALLDKRGEPIAMCFVVVLHSIA